jgi:DNA polymerase
MNKITKCNLCELCLNKAPINGNGNPNAEIMFIVDSPTYYDVKENQLLTKESGKLFDKLLTMINLKREDVYVTTLVKGRPYGNRIRVKNITACKPYLQEEIESVKPKIIVTMGIRSMQTILKTTQPISHYINNAIVAKGEVYILPMYNINYALRDVRNHGIALRDFINLYKVYSNFVNPNIKHYDEELHDVVKKALNYEETN